MFLQTRWARSPCQAGAKFSSFPAAAPSFTPEYSCAAKPTPAEPCLLDLTAEKRRFRWKSRFFPAAYWEKLLIAAVHAVGAFSSHELDGSRKFRARSC